MEQSPWRSRKFLMTMFGVGAITLAVVMGKLETQQWLDTLWKLLGVYMGGNAIAAWSKK